MDLLKAEIERKKKAVALAKSSSDGGAPEGRGYGKKRVYLKASAFRKLQDQADRGGGSTSCEGEGSKKRRRAEGGSPPTMLLEGRKRATSVPAEIHQSGKVPMTMSIMAGIKIMQPIPRKMRGRVKKNPVPIGRRAGTTMMACRA